MAADMLTNLVRELDDHDLSVLHTRNTQNGLVGVACVNPLHKKISRPGVPLAVCPCVWQSTSRTADVTVTKIAGYVRVRILMNRWFFFVFLAFILFLSYGHFFTSRVHMHLQAHKLCGAHELCMLADLCDWSAGGHGVTTMFWVSLRARRHTTQVMLGLSLRARWDTTLVIITRKDSWLTLGVIAPVLGNIQFNLSV